MKHLILAIILIILSGCYDKDKTTAQVTEQSFPVEPVVEKIAATSEEADYNDGLDEIWKRIFKEDYVKSPFLPVEYIREVPEVADKEGIKAIREIVQNQSKELVKLWRQTKEKKGPRAEILKYIFQEISFREIERKALIFPDEMKFEFARTLLGECSFKEGFKLLHQLKKDVKNKVLSAKIDLLLKRSAVNEVILNESKVNASNHNLQQFLPGGNIEIIMMEAEIIEFIEPDPSVEEEIDYGTEHYNYADGKFMWPPKNLAVKTQVSNFSLTDSKGGNYWIPGKSPGLSLKSEYKGEVKLKLYKFNNAEAFKSFKVEDSEHVSPLMQWTQTAGKLKDNNNGKSLDTKIELPLDPQAGFYILTAQMKFCPALVVKPFIVAENLYYVRQLPGTLKVLTLDARTLKPKKDVELKVDYGTNSTAKSQIIKSNSEGWAKMSYTHLSANHFTVTSKENPLLSKADIYSKDIEPKIIRSVWSSRPLYRPGEKAKFRGNIRAIHAGLNSAPSFSSVEVKIIKPNGKEHCKQTCILTENGSFHGEYQLQKSDPMGEYEYEIGEGHKFPAFKVGEFRLPRFQLIFAEDEIFTTENNLQSAVFLKHLNGTPLTNSAVSLTLSGKIGYSTTKTWTAKTDSQGKIDYRFTPKELDKNGTYYLWASYKSPSGEVIRNQQLIIINSNQFYVSLSCENQLVSNYLINANLFDHKGEEFTFDKIEWAVACDNGLTYLNSANLRQLDIKRSFKPHTVHCKITKDGKVYKDKIDLKQFRKSAADYKKGITVEAKQTAIPGETVKLNIFMNLKDNKQNYTVYLFGQNSALWHHETLQVKSGMNEVKVKIDQKWAPNIYFHAVYIQDHETTISDSFNLKVRKLSNELDLRSLSSKKTYKPGEICKLRFSCRDNDARPVEGAEISISAIDESLYYVKKDPTPPMVELFNRYTLEDYGSESFKNAHPFNKSYYHFLGPALTNNLFYSMHSRIQYARFYGGSAGYGMAAQKSLPKVRKGFALEAFWAPVVKTDKKGFAEVNFKMPDTITSWRITARAMSPKGKTGDHKNWITTSLPVETDVILPRIIRSGDQLEIPVSVINRNQDTSATLNAGAAISGKNLNNLSERFNISKNSLKSNFLNITAPENGSITFKSALHAGNHSDAVERNLKITPAGYPMRTVSQINVNRSAVFKPAQKDLIPGSMNVTLRLDNSLDHKLNSALDRLIKYRYGCAEQTISRFTPLIVVSDSFKKAGIKNPYEEKMPELIQEGLARLYRFQHADGGWKWYETGDSSYRVSILILEGLLEAKEQGVNVDIDVIQKGANYVKANFNKSSSSSTGSQIGAGDNADFLAAAVLSRYYRLFEDDETKKIFRKSIDLLKKRIKTDLEALNLCEAMVNLKMISEAEDLFSKYQDIRYDTSLRENVMTLSKKVYIAKRLNFDKFQDAKQLFEARKNGWWFDTRATNCAVRGLSGYLSVKREDCEIDVYLGKTKVGTLSQASQNLELPNVSGDIRLISKKGKPTSVSVTSEWHSVTREEPVTPDVTLSAAVISGSRNYLDKSISLDKDGSYTYKITLDSKVALNYCHLSIPRPAGMELELKPHLSEGVVSFEEYNDSFNFFIERLPAGKKTFEFKFRLELAGMVSAPAPNLGKMYGKPLQVKSTAPVRWTIK